MEKEATTRYVGRKVHTRFFTQSTKNLRVSSVILLEYDQNLATFSSKNCHSSFSERPLTHTWGQVLLLEELFEFENTFYAFKGLGAPFVVKR